MTVFPWESGRRRLLPDINNPFEPSPRRSLVEAQYVITSDNNFTTSQVARGSLRPRHEEKEAAFTSEKVRRFVAGLLARRFRPTRPLLATTEAHGALRC